MSPTPPRPLLSPDPVEGSKAAGSGMVLIVRMLLALLLAIALPAQAISASVERVWNAAHYHLDDGVRGSSVLADSAMPTRHGTIDEHYPLQRARAMASFDVHMAVANDVHSPTQAAALDTHAPDTHLAAHRAGVAHHHDAGARGVVYVADAGEPPMSTAERSGKHDHDGFSPANLVGTLSSTPHHRRVLRTVAPKACIGRLCEPGERPPR